MVWACPEDVRNQRFIGIHEDDLCRALVRDKFDCNPEGKYGMALSHLTTPEHISLLEELQATC